MISLSLRLIREHNRLYKCWMRLLWRLAGKGAPIVLMVHGFKPTTQDCESAFEMTASSFERLMRFLIEHGWEARRHETLLDLTSHRKSKCFYLTFDDIYDTVYLEAYPILKELNIPFTVFVTKDLVDKPGYITMEHFLTLAQDPLCCVGAHGLTHSVFRYLSGKEVEEQCVGCQQWLEQTLGVKVDAFAFPYGRIVEVSGRDRRIVKEAGFEIAFSALEGSVKSNWFTGRWFLPRVNVSEAFVNRFTQGKRIRWKDCEGR